MKKTKKIIVTLLMLMLFVFGISACTPDEGGGESKIPSIEKEESLTLSVYELSLTVGDEVALIANYDPIEGESVQFVSANPVIATVDEYGRIVANNIGETAITVTYGELSASCAVTVGYNGMLPMLMFEEISTEDVKVGLGESINISTYVLFNNIKFTDAVISYAYSDSSIGQIEDGVFTPTKVGVTTVTVSASWRGQENISTLKKVINIQSINVIEIVVNDGKTDFTMYNLPMLGDNEYHTSLDFIVTARENGETIESENVSIMVSEGTDIIKYTNDKVQALKPGNATVLISVTDKLGNIYTQNIQITVLTSIGEYKNEILFSAYDGELPIEDIFGAAVDLVSAVCEGETLSINENKNGVLGLSTSKEGPTSKIITVYSDTQAWKLNLLVYSGIIDEPSDLDMFHLGDGREADYRGFSEEDTFNGYYILADDIDCSGYIFGEGKGINLTNPGGIGVNSMLGVGLTGVFDGNGYSIINFTPNGAGLFAAINGGTLKNISISSEGSYTANGPYLCAMMRNATLENVNLDIGAINGYGTLGISKFILNSTLKNCVFKAQVVNPESTWGGLVRQVSNSSFKDCYAVSNKALSGDASSVYDALNCKDANDESNTVWIEGIKRYVSEEAMIADQANNDLTSFSKKYWNTNLGMPIWRGGFEFTVQDGDGNVLSDAVYLERGNEISLKVYAFGEEYATPILYVKDNDTIIQVNGTKLTALAAGSATLEIVWTAEGKEYIKTVQINVTLPVEDYSEKLLYSAKDGQFFNAQGNVVSVEDIFGDGTILLKATHTTDELSVADGKVFGLKTDGKNAVETAMVLYTENKVLKINITAYTLIIDEAVDLDYFYLGNDRGAETSVWSASDIFDGYYILAKNIDCTDYVFGASKENAGETPCNLTNPGGTGTNNLKNMGLTGTFDGRGYAITNFMPNGAGLFAAINGGTVKNVSISKCSDEWTFFQSGGSYLATVLRDATVENVYIYASRVLGYGTYGFARFILGDTVVKNCVINANAHTSAAGNTFREIAATASFENTYVINQYKLSNELNKDASNCTTDASVSVVGVKRYASMTEMIEDKANNSFASFSADYWDTASGMPVWKVKA